MEGNFLQTVLLYKINALLSAQDETESFFIQVNPMTFLCAYYFKLILTELYVQVDQKHQNRSSK